MAFTSFFQQTLVSRSRLDSRNVLGPALTTRWLARATPAGQNRSAEDVRSPDLLSSGALCKIIGRSRGRWFRLTGKRTFVLQNMLQTAARPSEIIQRFQCNMTGRVASLRPHHWRVTRSSGSRSLDPVMGARAYRGTGVGVAAGRAVGCQNDVAMRPMRGSHSVCAKLSVNRVLLQLSTLCATRARISVIYAYNTETIS
jgi:hypothetical protein